MSNFKYYLRETFSQFGTKSVLAIISTSFLLLLSVVLVFAYSVGAEYTERLASEAEIAVFYSSESMRDDLVRTLEYIEGVKSVTPVSEEEAFEEMKAQLGKEVSLLERLDSNPFEAYLRVAVEASISEKSLDAISVLPFVTHVRDNREVLQRIASITRTLAIAGALVVLTSVLTCAFMTYYVSSENIYSRREQIQSLRYMGAPTSFVLRPFVWHSVLVNLGAGLVSSAAFAYLVYRLRNMGQGAGFVSDQMVNSAVIIDASVVGLAVLSGVIASLLNGSKIKNQ